MLLILVHRGNARSHHLLKVHPVALFVLTLLISMFWEYFPIEIHMPAPVKRALQYIFGVGININEAFFIRFLFKLTSSGFFHFGR